MLVEDVTSRFACLGLWGPAAREILQPLAERRPVATTPSRTCARARSRRLRPVPRPPRHVRRRARLGALLPRWSSACRLWDTIWDAGREHGLVAGGYKAIDSLRLEKGYRVWGADITPGRDALRGGARASPSSSTRASSSAARRCSQRGDRPRSGSSPASSSTIRAPSRSARSRCAWTARSSAA